MGGFFGEVLVVGGELDAALAEREAGEDGVEEGFHLAGFGRV